MRAISTYSITLKQEKQLIRVDNINNKDTYNAQPPHRVQATSWSRRRPSGFGHQFFAGQNLFKFKQRKLRFECSVKQYGYLRSVGTAAVSLLDS